MTTAHDSTCTVPNCVNTIYGRGLCRAHYMRARRHGSPTAGRAERFAFPITDAPPPPLTETQARIIRRMFNQGAPIGQIVQFCRVDAHAVRSALRRAGQ